MLVIWNHEVTALASAETAPVPAAQFKLLHAYGTFDLVDYFGDTQALGAVAHQVTEDQAIHVHGKPVKIPRGQFLAEGHPRTLLRLAGPIVRPWLKVFRELKIKIHFWCPPYGVCVELPSADSLSTLVDKLPVVIGSLPYTEILCSRRNASSASKGLGVSKHWLDLVCFSEADKARIKGELHQHGHAVIGESRYKLRVDYHDATPAWLRELSGVKLADPARPSVTASLELADAMGVPQSLAWSTLQSLDGAGQVVAVADTGLDNGIVNETLHPDFRGRVNDLISWPINESWNSYVTQPGHDDGGVDKNTGHGTHVAGLVLGSGQASDGRYRGLAPKANLVFQAIEQFTTINAEHSGEISSGYYLSGRPLDLRDLFNEARLLGARIHVNAWGDPSLGAYTDDCYESDDFLNKNPDAVVLFAAGNDGCDKNGDRRIDERSLYSPAAAKNVIAIGATEGPRQGVGLRVSWDAFNATGQKRFTNRDDREDAISGDPEHIALISSAGPSRDGRIKPDLCAPGTNLAAPRSQATQGKGWGLASPLPYYMYYGGTSMATGAAGGYFALLRQSWQAYQNNIAPSGMALKALAVLAAQPVLRRESSQPEPRHVAGFGSINLQNALPGKENGIRLIDFREPGLHTGEVKSYSFRLNQSQHFKAVLSWYDVPGEILVNNLNLCLQSGNQILHWGNHPPGQIGEPDQHNNVELVEVDSLAPGDYTLRVIAANIPAEPQNFALAFLGPNNAYYNIPINWIKGIGKVYSSRLKDNGVENLPQLLSLSVESLKEILQLDLPAEKIFTTLLILDERLNWQLPSSIPGSVTLAELQLSHYPDVEDRQWQSATRVLLPLIGVFDRSRLNRIQLAHLYSLQL